MTGLARFQGDTAGEAQPLKSSENPRFTVETLGRELSTAVILFHESIAARLGINSAEWKCLGLLDQHGPLTAVRLAQLSAFTTGAITGIVDRLERAGYARREPNPADRRSVIIHPQRLEELRQQVASIFASLAQAMDRVTARFTPRELEKISEYLQSTVETLRLEADKINAVPVTARFATPEIGWVPSGGDGGLGRQSETKDGALSTLAFGPDAASVGLRNFAAGGETDAGTRYVIAVQTLERMKDVLGEFRRKPLAVILD